MKKGNVIFLLTFFGISCFFSAIYFLERSNSLFNLISVYGNSDDMETTYEINLLLFVLFAFLSSIFLALGISEWSSYEEVEKEVERVKEELESNHEN
jgi:hypothetical protein